ncbi:hypothetical protein Pint_10339 [Pistacia integerrima]|uniref:Uncharacterized protein n=1 Tax=Pistacia integerrima TaxID=434235 RepID=A0ACC0XKN3_9ROSI|nr:hypothetical protein Pint_10339 [Pistacia integerrima]
MLRMKNNEGDTALHEAVRNNYIGVVEILTKEDHEFSYSTNNFGETPLYIAVEGRSLDVVTKILETCKSASHEGTDGKTALHAAVLSGDLEFDRSSAYKEEKQRNMTALHMAASQGHENIMEAIISCCPECCEMVDDRGWNFLHFAMKDAKGNTPLHVLAVSSSDLDDRYDDVIEGVLTGHSFFLNKKNDSVKDILTYGSAELKQEIQELSKVVDVGPFRRAFTMPGGYQNEEGPQQGTGVLTRNAAFQAFVITDAVAMMFSLSAVFAYFIASTDTYTFLPLIVYSFRFTLISMVAMILAFVTGTYAVLAPSPGLAIAACTVCLSFFLSVFYLSYKTGHKWAEAKP